MLTALTIKNQHADIFTFLHGNLQAQADNCRVPTEATKSSLVYVSDASQLAEARGRGSAIVIMPAQMAACAAIPCSPQMLIVAIFP